MTSHTECPKCGFEIEMAVDLGEHMVDVFDECPECLYKFTQVEKDKIYSEALESAMGRAIDRAHDLAKDRRMGI